MQKLFPIILMCLNLCASASYFYKGDIKHGIYWLAAFVLTGCVTF
jgi:hypothetical protein